MSVYLTDDELDLAIATAKREWLRLIRIRSRRRFAKTVAANPDAMARKFTPEVRARMSAAQKGKPRSQAQRDAISAGLVRYHQQRKAATRRAAKLG